MKKACIWLLIFLFAVTNLFTGVMAQELTGVQEYRYIHELAEYIEKNAKFPEHKSTLLDAALLARLTKPEGGFNAMVDGMMECLDEHSSYITAEELQPFIEHVVTGEFTGIGVNISLQSEAYVVITAIPGSPAEAAGIVPGDILTAVDGVDITGMTFDVVRAKITGQEGTTVKITVKRGEESLTFSVVRKRLEEKSVQSQIKDGIGFITMTRFTTTSSREIREALNSFSEAGVENVVFDLRDNPGGELEAALDVCRMFTPKGVIMRIEYADSAKNELYYNENDAKEKFNLVVLVNEGSASASELVAGAILDTESGYLIGEKTFGKGTMQIVRNIRTGGAIRLTVAEYKTAGGRSVHHKGITPHMIVKNRMIVPDISYMHEMQFATEWKEGDVGQAVLAIEERLAFLGYIENADETFGADTAAAIRIFQAQCKLPVTGNADIYTQVRLDNVEYDTPVEQDDQMAAAMEYFNAAA